MGTYRDRVLPWLIHLVMRQKRLTPYRDRLILAATGRVLEIGIGSGLNLPFYRSDVREILGLDPSPRLLEIAGNAARHKFMPLKLVKASAEAIPLDNRSVDTVVTSWTLCSIPEVEQALKEMLRVLKPSGSLLFVEHGRAPEPRIQWWQDHLTPAWKHLAGGCHLNRAIAPLIVDAGFRIDRLHAAYMGGPKPMTFMYEGRAEPR